MSKLNISVEVGGSLGEVMRNLRKQWPRLQYGMMSEIGYIGRRSLYENYLRGQVINLKAYLYGKDGIRKTVSYAISKKRDSVKIRSYPLNLFDPRNVYANAAPTVQASINNALRDYNNRVLESRIRKLDRDK